MSDTFTGAEREWSDWVEQFEMAADVNNWDEPLRLKCMGLLLSGRAHEVYSGFSEMVNASYVLLKEALGSCWIHVIVLIGTELIFLLGGDYMRQSGNLVLHCGVW